MPTSAFLVFGSACIADTYSSFPALATARPDSKSGAGLPCQIFPFTIGMRIDRPPQIPMECTGHRPLSGVQRAEPSGAV
ncbi:MAG: hypothetical protein HWD61_02765 [Parachlamydiaceae bacterium]|nr:MAG: hypothetical protein HWD61_02765 [Parachlamydiaceae bacterium]